MVRLSSDDVKNSQGFSLFKIKRRPFIQVAGTSATLIKRMGNGPFGLIGMPLAAIKQPKCAEGTSHSSPGPVLWCPHPGRPQWLSLSPARRTKQRSWGHGPSALGYSRLLMRREPLLPLPPPAVPRWPSPHLYSEGVLWWRALRLNSCLGLSPFRILSPQHLQLAHLLKRIICYWCLLGAGQQDVIVLPLCLAMTPVSKKRDKLPCKPEPQWRIPLWRLGFREPGSGGSSSHSSGEAPCGSILTPGGHVALQRKGSTSAKSLASSAEKSGKKKNLKSEC